MNLFDFSAVLAAARLWGPPAARWFDSLFGYGVIVLFLAMIAWKAYRERDDAPRRR